MNAPKITIGKPTPRIIGFEVISKNDIGIYMNFMLTLVRFFGISIVIVLFVEF
jgi:hypothetical protein